MLFTSALVSIAVLISGVFAVPHHLHQPGSLHHAENGNSSDTVELGYNWAGAVLSKSVGTFYHITGTFVVPLPRGSKDTFASVWVGIDGSKCFKAMLQTGIQMSPDGKGGGVYTAWYEWYPKRAYPLDLAISAGDIVTLTVTAHSSTHGVVTIDNVSQRKTARKELSSQYELCLQDAEWVVEDPMGEDGAILPFANFGTVHFYDTDVSGSGRSYNPTKGNVVLISTPDETGVLTSVATDEHSVTIGYIDN